MSTVVLRLAGTFGPSLTDKEIEERGAVYVRLLQRFPQEILLEAFDEVLREWKRTDWPPVGVFYEHCRRIREAQAKPERLPAPEKWRQADPVPVDKALQLLDEHGPGMSEGLRRRMFSLMTQGAEYPGAPDAGLSEEEQKGRRIVERTSATQTLGSALLETDLLKAGAG